MNSFFPDGRERASLPMEPGSLRDGVLRPTRARTDGAQESLDTPDAMDVGDGHPTHPVPGSSQRLHAQGGADQVYNPPFRHIPLTGATLEGFGSTSTAGPPLLSRARISGAGLMPTFENSVPYTWHTRQEIPVRKTWQAEEGPELEGECGAHLVASTAHDPAATARAPPPAALESRAQPVAAAPKVLRRPVPSLGDRVIVREDDSDEHFANHPAPRAFKHQRPLAPASSNANGSSTPSHDDGVEHPTRIAPSGARARSALKRPRLPDATTASVATQPRSRYPPPPRRAGTTTPTPASARCARGG